MLKLKFLLKTFLFLVVYTCASSYGKGQVYQFDKEGVYDETNRENPEPGKLSKVGWFPKVFWEAYYGDLLPMTEKEWEKISDFKESHIFITVEDGSFNDFGIGSYRDKEEVREELRINSPKGEKTRDQIPSDISDLLAALKNTLFPVKEQKFFFVFDALDGAGKRIVDPHEKGTFTVLLGEEKYQWDLPLKYLLERKDCPNCGRKVKGAYNYCPKDGSKLE